MSPTSYQTAPPRNKDTKGRRGAGGCQPSVQAYAFPSDAGGHGVFRKVSAAPIIPPLRAHGDRSRVIHQEGRLTPRKDPMAGACQQACGHEFLLTPGNSGMLTETRLAQSALLVGMGRSAPEFVEGLQREGVLTLVVHRLSECMEAARRIRPELVILLEADPALTDIPLCPDLVEALRGVEGVGHILVLIESTDPAAALELLAHGADDVVAPPHFVETVLLRARLARERESVQSTLPAPFRTIRIGTGAEVVEDDDGMIELTGRERQVLARLLGAAGEAVPRRKLLEEIWGPHQESVAVLDATIHRLRRKLEANPANPKIITTVRGVGYRLEIARVERI